MNLGGDASSGEALLNGFRLGAVIKEGNGNSIHTITAGREPVARYTSIGKYWAFLEPLLRGR